MHRLTQSKNNSRALELRRYQGVCHRTAWLVKHKLMEVMHLREDGRQLTGRVEIDDAYLGGERSDGKSGEAPRTRCRLSPRCRPPKTGRPSWLA